MDQILNVKLISSSAIQKPGKGGPVPMDQDVRGPFVARPKCGDQLVIGPRRHQLPIGRNPLQNVNSPQ